MPIPKLSRTINAILGKRGSAPTPTAKSKEPLDKEAESPSTSTTVGATIPASPESSPEPSTSAKVITDLFTTLPDNIPLTSLSVASFLFSSRPLPQFDLRTPGGVFVSDFARSVEVAVPDVLEKIVAWAYRCGPGWGEKTLEDVALFYKNNRPELWGF